MFGSLHPGSGETVPEFDAPYTRDGEDCVGNQTLHGIPEGFSETYEQILALDGALHYSSQGITFGYGLLELFLYLRVILRVGRQLRNDSAHLYELGGNAHILQHLLGYIAGCHYGQGDAAGEMPAAAIVLEIEILHCRSQVGVTRTGSGQQLAVVLRTSIVVEEHYGKGSACGHSVQHSAHQAGTVLLHTGRGSQPSRFAAGYFLHHLLFRNLQARKHSVYGASYHRSVGLPEDGDPENPAETVHSCSNIWLNSGNDLETQSSSSMTRGESAASEATFRAISIRWS